MSWRFRKTFGRGPFRWTLNKRGVGWSVGISGFRAGVSPNGHRHVSIGIPGTGLYWFKNLDSKSQPQLSSSQPAGQAHTTTASPQTSSKPGSAEPWWNQKGLRG